MDVHGLVRVLSFLLLLFFYLADNRSRLLVGGLFIFACIKLDFVVCGSRWRFAKSEAVNKTHIAISLVVFALDAF